MKYGNSFHTIGSCIIRFLKAGIGAGLVVVGGWLVLLDSTGKIDNLLACIIEQIKMHCKLLAAIEDE